MNRAVFLDRDGVLNEAILRDGHPFPPRSIQELKIYADAGAALNRLRDAGFLLIVVTNQPDVARGTQTREAVGEINTALRVALPISDVFVCWHDDSDACACRKPKPGLLLEAAKSRQIEIAQSFMIGDRWRDIDAGAAAGCRTVLIERNYRERSPQNEPDFRTASLSAAVDWILSNAESSDEQSEPVRDISA